MRVSDRHVTVLIVDDEPLIRSMVSDLFAARGHAVFEAEDGHTAIRLVRERGDAFDAVLLDYHLPDSHDLSLLQALRPLVPRAAIVMLTGSRTPHLVTEALALGAHAVVSKPFSLDALERLVVRLAAGSEVGP